MDINNISQLVGSLGFPIVVCGALCFFIWHIFQQATKTNKENMEQLQANCKEREDKLYNEIRENREINGKFAEIIAKYDIKLDNIQRDVEDIKNKIK